MLKNYYPYLRDIGLSEIQIRIYDHIIENRSGTINEIKDILNYSYAQVSYNLSVLEDMDLIFSSQSKKNKRYYRIDPKIALTKVLDERVKNFKEQIEKIDETIKIEESSHGRCARNVSFYTYSDFNLAIENYFRLIKDSKKEICMSAMPPSLLKKIESPLYNAFMRGVNIVVYYSDNDFESLENYFDEITTILKRIGVKIIQTRERTCQLIRYNDIIANNGVILIDEVYLNSVIFIDDDIFMFEGFQGATFVIQSKKFLEINQVIKQINIDYPESIQNVLNIIKEHDSIVTRDLSGKSKLGGGKLKEILEYLIAIGTIKETVVKGDKAGKPRREYSVI